MKRFEKIRVVFFVLTCLYFFLTTFSDQATLRFHNRGNSWLEPFNRFLFLPGNVSANTNKEVSPSKPLIKGEIFVLQVDGVINPVVASYLRKRIERTQKEKAGLIIIQMDTPGGLDKSMRLIIKDILSSEVPIVVFVAPSGSRAASAGTFITMAAHIAAMAPGTNLGAAHPVQMGGEMDEEMKKKVENDAIAYIKSLAEKRGRNAEWAEKAVKESVSISEREALELNVIDLIAENIADLIEKLHNREFVMEKGPVALQTKGQKITHLRMSYSERILDAISDPTLAYILLILGFYGLFFELASPGVILPGIFGAISLILGLYALQTLPVNYAGLLLLILGIILFLLEIWVTSFGALTIGGIISMLLGSLMLFDSPAPYMRVSLEVILTFTLGTAAIFTFLIGASIRAMLRQPTTGFEGMIGKSGIVKTPLNPNGTVFVHGELWKALSQNGPIEPGETIEVFSREGFTLHVKKKGDRK